MEGVREEVEKIVFGYLDLSERAQDPGELIDQIVTLKAQTAPVDEVPCSAGVMPRFMDKMRIDFERYVSSNFNWPVERTGDRYHDWVTDGAWKVFKFAKVA